MMTLKYRRFFCYIYNVQLIPSDSINRTISQQLQTAMIYIQDMGETLYYSTYAQHTIIQDMNFGNDGLNQSSGRPQKQKYNMLSKIGQAPRDKYCMISLIC